VHLKQLFVQVFLPILACGVASAVQCKVQGEKEIGRCALGGALAGAVTVAFFFLALALGGDS
jgi:hypothetical protein